MQYDQKVVREALEEERYLPLSHLTLKDPLRIQALHLTEVRGRVVTRTVHVMNLRRQGRLPSMVR